MVSIIIPAYNEAGSIKEVVRKVRETLDKTDYTYEIIVVDDGSTDGTSASLIGQDVAILTHPENKGYGASLKTGIRSAKGDVIVITDADGTYPPEMIPRLLGGMDEGYDMVVGARTGKDVNIPILRRPAKFFLKKLADYLSETKIPDLNSGLRAFRKELALKYFHLLPSGFSFTTTITLALISDGYNVNYIPIDYRARSGGKSKIRPIKDFSNFIMLIVRVICYFNPLKIFLPASLLFLAVGVYHVAQTLILYHRITEAGLLAVLLGFQIGFIGLITDVMVRRDRWIR
ncbi:MAG: glycosyltransferase family 2 protein [Nitrospirota bacterium]